MICISSLRMLASILLVKGTDGFLSSHRKHHKWAAEFSVQLDENRTGNFTIEVHPHWAHNGAKRFHELVKTDFFKGERFFRVVPNFMAQIGISGDPKIAAEWRSQPIPDEEKVMKSNRRGYVTFAKAGPNSRTTQFFINTHDNQFLDAQGFAPFGRVIDGMHTVDFLYSGYGESEPNGNGPTQARIQAEGNSYLVQNFPKLSYVTGCSE